MDEDLPMTFSGSFSYGGQDDKNTKAPWWTKPVASPMKQMMAPMPMMKYARKAPKLQPMKRKNRFVPWKAANNGFNTNFVPWKTNDYSHLHGTDLDWWSYP